MLGEGIVLVSSAHTNGGDYVQVASDHVETLYAYGLTGCTLQANPALQNNKCAQHLMMHCLTLLLPTMLVQKTNSLSRLDCCPI